MPSESPTSSLLLTLARGRLSESEQAQACRQLAEPDVDWWNLVELASLHGVVALVRRNLLALDARSTLPDPVFRAIDQASAQIAFDGLLHLHQTRLAVDALRQAGIEPILLKGHALAALVYDDPLVRPSSDVDLLVRRSEIDAACTALERLGGQLPSPETTTVQRETSYDLPLMFPSAGGKASLLELHWDLAPRGLFALDLDAWRARAVEFTLEGQVVSRLSHEDMLLHLALHMRKHRYVGLRWLCDVAELLRRFAASLDWAYVRRTAQAAGLSVLLYTSLQLAEQLFEAPVDRAILQEIAPSSLRRRLLQEMLSQQALLLPVERDESGWTRLAPAEILLLDRPIAMARELRYRLAPPSEALLGSEATGMTRSQRLAFGAHRLADRTATLLKRS